MSFPNELKCAGTTLRFLRRSDLAEPAQQHLLNIFAESSEDVICSCNRKVILFRRGQLLMPRALPHDQQNHQPSCDATTDRSGDPSSPITQPNFPIEGILDQAYLAEVDLSKKLTSSSPMKRFREMWETSYQYIHGHACKCELFYNKQQEENDTHSRVLNLQKNPSIEIPAQIRLRTRLSPHGTTVQGIHFLVIAQDKMGNVYDLCSVPVHLDEEKNMIHPIDSSHEDSLLKRLDELGIEYIKPPSLNFLRNTTDYWWGRIGAQLAARDILPDVIFRRHQSVTALELFGFHGIQYEARSSEKIFHFRILEPSGLSWCACKPSGRSFELIGQSADKPWPLA